MSKELGVALLTGLLPNCDAQYNRYFRPVNRFEAEDWFTAKRTNLLNSLPTPTCCRRACQRLPRLLRLQLFHR